MNEDERISLYDGLAKSVWGGERELDIETRLVRTIFEDRLQRYSGRVLNLGCGDFQRYGMFDHFDEIIGFDIAEPALRKAKNHSVSALLRGDAERLPFVNDSFDLVFTDQVLEHLPNPEEAISEIQRVADAAIICVPNDALETQRLVNRVRGYDPRSEIGHLHSKVHPGWRTIVEESVDIQYERGVKLFNIVAMPSLSFFHRPISWFEERVDFPRWSYYSIFEGPTT